jgi:hypothetical protein
MLDSETYAFDDHSSSVFTAGLRRSGILFVGAESLS